MDTTAPPAEVPAWCQTIERHAGTMHRENLEPLWSGGEDTGPPTAVLYARPFERSWTLVLRHPALADVVCVVASGHLMQHHPMSDDGSD